MKRSILFRNQYWNSSHIVLLFLLAILCFWPLAFGIFSAKNDNITQFLPVRFHVSEALRNGQLPLWNPYMYLGYPIHGDMQGGAWNPVVWLLSLFGRYNVHSLHAEILFYIFLSGCGMYRLLGEKIQQASIKLAGAVAYMLCGYVVDVAGSNIPFLAGAAYTPFVFAYYHQLLVSPSAHSAIKSSIGFSLLFVSAYPSFFIITCYTLLAALLVVLARDLARKKGMIKPLLTYQALMVLFFLCLSGPAIISYWQILPFYQRGDGVNLAQAMVNSFHPYCSLSLILPTATFKTALAAGTDLISRSVYFNCLLLVFFSCYFLVKKSLFFNFILAGIIFFFLFSLGDYTPVRGWCYHLLPLMDTFRHPSNARLFVIIGSIVMASYVYQSFFINDLPKKYFRMIAWVLLIGLVAVIIFYLNQTSIRENISVFTNSDVSLRRALKNFFDSLSFQDLIVLNGIVQIIFLSLFLFVFNKSMHSLTWLTVLLIANSFVFAQFSLPYTVVSKTSPHTINALLRQFPYGYPKPDTSSIDENSVDVHANFDTLGISGLYNKKMALTNAVYTPTFMLPLEKTFKDSTARELMFSNPYAYFAETIVTPSAVDPELSVVYTNEPSLLTIDEPGQGNFELMEISSNRFRFHAESTDNAVFVLQQVYLPGWKCFIDNKEARIFSVNTAFMAVQLKNGKHDLVFEYRPVGIGAALILTMLTLLITIFLLQKRNL